MSWDLYNHGPVQGETICEKVLFLSFWGYCIHVLHVKMISVHGPLYPIYTRLGMTWISVTGNWIEWLTNPAGSSHVFVGWVFHKSLLLHPFKLTGRSQMDSLSWRSLNRWDDRPSVKTFAIWSFECTNLGFEVSDTALILSHQISGIWCITIQRSRSSIGIQESWAAVWAK